VITVQIKPGLTRTGSFDPQATRREAERVGYTTFVLPERGIVDRASFFEAVRATLPLDPPVVGSSSWEALSDSLWEGLFCHSAQRIAILWLGTQTMATSAPKDLETALDVLADVANLLADPEATVNTPKEIAGVVEYG